MQNNVFTLRQEIKKLLISHCAWIQSVPQEILENFPSFFLNAVNLSVTSWKGQSTYKLHTNRILSWMFCWIVYNFGSRLTKGNYCLGMENVWVEDRYLYCYLFRVSVDVRYSARFCCCIKYYSQPSPNKIHVLSRPNKYFISAFEVTHRVFIR
jgi:hypothetical protein